MSYFFPSLQHNSPTQAHDELVHIQILQKALQSFSLTHTETHTFFMCHPAFPIPFQGVVVLHPTTCYCLNRQSTFISLTEKTLIYFNFSLEAAGCHT